MSQTCDLDNRTWIQVAPVYRAGQFGAKKLASLQANDITFMFYLPEKPPSLSETSYADLSQITTVHRSYLEQGNRILQLRPATTARLQSHLGDFYGRPFGFNIQDTVPQDATYLCMNCFLSSATVQRKDLAKDCAFSDCLGCGPRAIWVKFS